MSTQPLTSPPPRSATSTVAGVVNETDASNSVENNVDAANAAATKDCIGESSTIRNVGTSSENKENKVLFEADGELPMSDEANDQNAATEATAILQKKKDPAAIGRPQQSMLQQTEFTDRNFNDYLYQFLLFRADHGKHATPLNSPSAESKESNALLCGWVNFINSQLESGQISGERLKVLNSIQFPWISRDAKWNMQFRKLQEYNTRFGNTNMPELWEEDTELGMWVEQMIELKKNVVDKGGRSPVLTEERIRLLEELGFRWSLKNKDLIWEKRFQELCQYREKHGNCDVPQRDIPLGKWVSKMRTGYRLYKDWKECRLTEERMRRLDSLNFKWGVIQNKKSFLRKKYDSTVHTKPKDSKSVKIATKATKKDLIVNMKTTDSLNASQSQNGPPLSNITSKKRKTPTSSSKSPVRTRRQPGSSSFQSSPKRQKTTTICTTFAFPFGIKDDFIDKFVTHFQTFRNKSGRSLTASESRNGATGISLHTTIKQINACYQKGQLTVDQINRLKSVNFPWSKTRVVQSNVNSQKLKGCNARIWVGGVPMVWEKDSKSGSGVGNMTATGASVQRKKPIPSVPTNPSLSSPAEKVVESGHERTGRWTREEHEAFLLALKQYGKDWNKVAAQVKTRTALQTRTHGQKYFQKLQKDLEKGGG